MRAGAREAGSDSALSVTTQSPNFLTKGKLRIAIHAWPPQQFTVVNANEKLLGMRF